MIKSFVAFPKIEGINGLSDQKNSNKKLVVYYELYKLIKDLDGSLIKCGITTDEAFSYFSFFQEMNNTKHNLIAFEKSTSVFEEVILNDTKNLAVKNLVTPPTEEQKQLAQKANFENISFLPGPLSDTIPNYLISNPELKIALLTIDLDDYETTLTAMQYLYPRIIAGGILIINNFYKKQAEFEAINEYFFKKEATIQQFTIENSPYYIIKD